MVFEPEVFKYLEHDQTILEAHVLERLAEDRQLAAYKHDGFWQCMDTMRDVKTLESLWATGNPPVGLRLPTRARGGLKYRVAHASSSPASA